MADTLNLLDPILPDWPDLPSSVSALSTTRKGGFSFGPFDDSKGEGGLNLAFHVGDDADVVRQNRLRLQSILPAIPAWLSQVHGVAVLDAAAVVPGKPQEADASVASKPGVVCAVMTADCLPVLFADLDGKVVGAAHAGWRGLAAGVLDRTVQAMRAAGAGELTAWMGPAIGARQFEVGSDVVKTFVGVARSEDETRRMLMAFAPHPDRPGKFLADIYQLARLMLAHSEVQRVHGGNACTVSDAARFYSYRRDNVTGRQATLIWLK